MVNVSPKLHSCQPVPAQRAKESTVFKITRFLEYLMISKSIRCLHLIRNCQSYQSCRNLSHLYFWLIRSFTDPAYTCSIFVVRFLADCLSSKVVSLCHRRTGQPPAPPPPPPPSSSFVISGKTLMIRAKTLI